ncbi:hypothetical protein RIF29_06236 [Crotalaria pallida]|uniref:Uncharacterized protein n=1 Tax=Crotalaria pallida TaxID=3830 RepID=A0AAN9J5L0_CROPI
MWLWQKILTQPYTTIFGIDMDGRRLWVPTMMKDIDKKSIVAVQAIRNMIMGSTLMATTSILLCAGMGSLLSSTYGVKKPINDYFILGAQGEFVVALKYASLLAIFSLSFLCHTQSIRFLNQLNILICIPQDVMSLVTPAYLREILEKASILYIVGNRLCCAGLSLLLWIFGPVLAFLSLVAMVALLYNLDYVAGNDR